MSSKARIALGAPVVLLSVIVGFLWQTGFFPRSAPPEKITIGSILSRISGLVYVAEYKGYFKDQGLNVTVKTNTSSLESIKDLKDGTSTWPAAGSSTW